MSVDFTINKSYFAINFTGSVFIVLSMFGDKGDIVTQDCIGLL